MTIESKFLKYWSNKWGYRISIVRGQSKTMKTKEVDIAK